MVIKRRLRQVLLVAGLLSIGHPIKPAPEFVLSVAAGAWARVKQRFTKGDGVAKQKISEEDVEKLCGNLPQAIQKKICAR